MIEITEVIIRKITSTNKVKAIVTIVINNCFAINDIKLVESQNGFFIVMPSRKTPNGEFKDIAHPINADTRENIQNAILKKYKEID